MAVYAYKGISRDSGKAVKGYRDADSPKALRAALRRDGVLLTQATVEAERQERAKKDIDLKALFQRVSAGDVAIMTRQLATLVKAGIPLVECISALAEQVEKEILVRVLTSVRESLKEGNSFADSLSAHPKVFPPLYVSMAQAGEASGTLEAVLARLADFMEKQADLKGKVMGAMIYPAVMVVVGTLLVSALMIGVVPKVKGIFDNLGRELPWYTKLLMWGSETLGSYWWLFLGLIIVGGIAFQQFIKNPEGRMKWDTFKLRVPLFGRLNQLVAVARFSRTLATLRLSGVPLLKAMDIVKSTLLNKRLEQVVGEAAGSIREGESIAQPLKRSGEFPPMVIHMIAVGERSGELEAMLENVSSAYETEVDVRVQTLVRLLEPMTILALGVVVGFIAVSILFPLMQMNQSIG
jgi:general secretion pathway protein F